MTPKMSVVDPLSTISITQNRFFARVAVFSETIPCTDMYNGSLDSPDYCGESRLYEVVFTSLGHKAKSKSYFGG